MTNEGMIVRLYYLIPNPRIEAAGALKEGNLGLEEEEEEEEGSLDAVVAVATQTEGDQKLKERISFHQKNV